MTNPEMATFYYNLDYLIWKVETMENLTSDDIATLTEIKSQRDKLGKVLGN